MSRPLDFVSSSGASATVGGWPSWVAVLGAAVATAWLVSLLVLLCGNSSAKEAAVDDVQKKANQAKASSGGSFPTVVGPLPGDYGGGACCCCSGGGGGGCGGCACGGC